MTDEQMLTLLRFDADKGLKQIMSAYSGLAYSIAASILPDSEDRHEAVNDAFYKVWRARDDIDLSRAGLKSYVAMVTRSCCLNKLKSMKQYEPLPDSETDLGIDVDFGSDESARVNEGIIRECVSSMPSPDREVFISRYYYEKPVADIARELGLKERRVEYILQKGKRRLKKALLKGGILL